MPNNRNQHEGHIVSQRHCKRNKVIIVPSMNILNILNTLNILNILFYINYILINK